MVSNIRFQISEDDGKGLNRRLFLAVLLSTLWFPVHGRTSITEDGLQYPFSRLAKMTEKGYTEALPYSALEYLVVPGSRAHKHHRRWSPISVFRLPKIVF
jgi:hypothetical protein